MNYLLLSNAQGSKRDKYMLTKQDFYKIVNEINLIYVIEIQEIHV